MKSRKQNVGIAGMGFYFPNEIVNTRTIVEEEGLEEKAYTISGIDYIYKPSDEDTPSYMAYNSAVEAMKDANVAPEDIDMIVTAVFKNDYWHWQMSAWLKDRLGAVNASTLEVKGGCAAHFFAIETAVDQICGSDYINTVLVVCSERMYGYGWPTFLSSGSQAVMLKRDCEKLRYLGFYTSNMIRYHENAYIKAGGTAYPFSEDTEWKGEGFIENIIVNKDMYFEHIKPNFFDRFREVTDNLTKMTGKALSEVKYMVTLTQQKDFEKRILNSIGLPDVPCGREYKNDLGHFSGADSYIVLDKAIKDGKIRKGDLILSLTIGGIAWCGTFIEY